MFQKEVIFLEGNNERRRISEERIKKLLPLYYSGKYESTIEFLREHNISNSVFYPYLRRHNLKSLQSSTRKHMVDDSFFKNIDSEIKAYWLGFIQCDGYINHNELELGLCAKDRSHIEKFLKHVNSNYPISNRVVAGKYDSCRVLIRSCAFVEPLLALGVEKFRSLTMKVLMPASNKLFKHYLRGILDANGSISLIEGVTTIRFNMCLSSGSINFMQQLLHEIEEFTGEYGGATNH